MSLTKSLLGLLDQQEALQEKLREEARRIDSMDFVSRNQELEGQIAALELEVNRLEEAREALDGENQQLKTALIHKAYQQKRLDAAQAAERMQEDYQRDDAAYMAELAALEQTYRRVSAEIHGRLRAQLPDQAQALREQLDACHRQLDDLIRRQRAEMEAAGRQAFAQIQQETERVAKQPLTAEELRRMTAGNNMEFRLGGKAANILGVLLVLVGVVAGLQYTYTHLLTSPALKSAAAYLLGGLFLAGGELLGRKRRTVFSLGITAGGVGILFASTALSFLVLEVLGLYAAFGLCVLVAGASLLLSLRYDSQTIGCFALAGGYLPVYAVAMNSSPVLYSLMGYLILLTFFTLLISARKSWLPLQYISLGCHLLATGWIVLGSAAGAPLSLGYVMAGFVLYTFVCVLYPLRRAKPMAHGSFAMIPINLIANCAFVFAILTRAGLDRWRGTAALLLGAFYYLFSRYLAKRMGERTVPVLFLAAALVLAVLAVPLQFDQRWLAMGWLLESAALIGAGLLLRERWYIRVGGGAYLLSLLSFAFFDLWELYSGFTCMKFTAIAAASLFILGAGLYVNRETRGYLYTREGKGLRWFKHYLTLLCLAYLQYLGGYLFSLLPQSAQLWDRLALAAVVSAGYAWLLGRIRGLRDRVSDAVAMVLFAFSALMGLALNLFDWGEGWSALPPIPAYLALNLFAFLGAWYFLKLLAAGRMNPQIQPLALFSYLLAVILEMMMVQAHLEVADMLLSFVLACAALLYIVYGFRRLNAYTRRVGLGLAVAALVKFFVVDLSFLGSGQRILSYFVLGLTLIGISFVYQRFAKQALELSGVSLTEEDLAAGPGEGKGEDGDEE